jgi:hypothetical protein
VPGNFNMSKEGPYTVVEKKSNVSYRIGSDNEKKTNGGTCRSHDKNTQGRESPQATNVVAPGRMTKSKARVAPKQNVVQHRYSLRETIKAPKIYNN